MRASNHHRVRRVRSFKRRAVLVAGVLGVVFVLINIVMVAAYWNRALPHSNLGRLQVSGKQLSSLSHVSVDEILPATVTVSRGQTAQLLAPSSLGIVVDASAATHSLKTSWLRWLPALSLLVHQHATLHISVNSARFGQITAQLANAFNQPSLPRHIVFRPSQSAFVVAPAENGYTFDSKSFQADLIAALQAGRTQLTAPVVALPASPAGIDPSPQLTELQKQLDTKLNFIYLGTTISPSASDKASWFANNGQGLSLAAANVAAYVAKVGQQKHVSIANQNDIATAAMYALGKHQALSLVLVPADANTVVRTYCTATRDVSNAVLSELEGKLAATYADVRGWNDSGQIAFRHVDSGCQYTVWMAASSQMTSFGAICDDYYNCQVGTNVVMNYDRWTSATPPWNQTGGSLEDYHTLMIDHETGHRLGFLDNPTCPGAGQPAPVMMQQSIDLKGCIFNIWPRPAEFAQLDRSLGIAPTSVNIQE